MNKMKSRIAKAKESALGRFFCRLMGDEGGAVMMEYVVLGVLVVAAAVAIVIAFGDTIVDQFNYMIDVLTVGPDQAKKNLEDRRQKRQGQAGAAQTNAQAVHFNDAGGGGSTGGN